MTSFISDGILDGLGKGYSIAGLALAIPFCFAFRNYLRFLDHLQLFFAYSILLGLNSNLFSNSLNNSWILFPYNLYYFCTPTQFVCTAGFPLSFGSCLVLFLIAMRLIVAIETWRKKQIRFEPVYTFFKGLTRWVYAPLTYYSVYFLISSIKGTSSSLLPSVLVLAVCVIFPIAQLIGYKIIQTQDTNIWKKWIQFFNFARLFIVCTLAGLGNYLGNKIYFYLIYGVYVIYAILYTVKNEFHFPVVGRIIFIAGEVLMIGVFSLFILKIDLLRSYSLDLLLISALFLLDLVYYIVELISYCRNLKQKQTMGAKVSPQVSQQRIGKNKKNNSYDIDLNDIDNQFDGNNNSRQQIFTKQQDSPYLKNKGKGGRARR